jgi:hypothetical protein
MKKIILIFLICFPVFTLLAQDEFVEKTVDKPVRSPFESAYLIDNQTTYIPYKNTLEFVIQHKFGTVEEGVSDLFGIYAPGANVRIGFNFVVHKNVQVGWGITKSNMANDLNVKWTIVEQTRNNTMPVAIALYGVAGINGEPDEYFGKDYNFTGRFSFFAQAIVSRKFNNWLTLQAGGSFSHFNMVDRTKSDFDKVSVHLNGRMKFSERMSFIFNYDQPLSLLVLTNKNGVNSNPNLAAGIEISTSTHAFQIYAGQYSGILPQDIMVKNYNDLALKNFAIGFTITRLWSFK